MRLLNDEVKNMVIGGCQCECEEYGFDNYEQGGILLGYMPDEDECRKASSQHEYRFTCCN